MGGISIHVGRLAFGLGFIGRLLSPAIALGSGVPFWERVQAIPKAMSEDTAYQRDLAVAGGGYMAIRAIGPSVEKKPLIELGKLRIYAL